MKIIDVLNSGKVTVSCELFPPKVGSELEKASTVVAKTAALHPSFISVTYGASGGTSAINSRIKKNINPAIRLMCNPEIDRKCASPERR